MKTLNKFWHDEDGGESAEWPLVLALVAIAAIAAFTLLGGKVSTRVNTLATAIGGGS
jgi:Flp pilus assembly pilin Flp